MTALGLLDRFALVGMGLGLMSMLQPWWAPGFQAGFFLTLGATILHIYTSHQSVPPSPSGRGEGEGV